MNNQPVSSIQPDRSRYAWLGLAAMIAVQVLLFTGSQTAATWLTPLMWSGYILLADGLLLRLTGRSWLRGHLREFPLLLLISTAVWLIFEAYNLHLVNWLYLNVPPDPIARNWAYLWSFSTIMPAIFITSDVLWALLRRRPRRLRASSRRPSGPAWGWFILGLAFVTIPLALPRPHAAYTFGMVWLGYIFLLDPINERIGLPSFRRLWSAGEHGRILSLLLGGMICGLLWEAWNFEALIYGGGHWVYTIPDALRVFDLHYGQMPVLGLLGFPPFAVELYAFYRLIRSLLDGERLLGPYIDDAWAPGP
jgi:hypothetical protein